MKEYLTAKMSWKTNMALLIVLLESGGPSGKQYAKEELSKLAKSLDIIEENRKLGLRFEGET